MDLLRTDIDHRDGWTLVTLAGQLDIATAVDLRQVLVEAQFSEDHRLLVDLDGVEFIDAMGFGILLEARKRAHTHDGRLVVRATTERIRRELRLTGLDQVLEVVEDAEEALGARD